MGEENFLDRIERAVRALDRARNSRGTYDGATFASDFEAADAVRYAEIFVRTLVATNLRSVDMQTYAAARSLDDCFVQADPQDHYVGHYVFPDGNIPHGNLRLVHECLRAHASAARAKLLTFES